VSGLPCSLLVESLLALPSRKVTVARRAVALLASGVPLAGGAVERLTRRITLMGRAIAFAGDCVSLLRSASAELSCRLPLPRGLAREGPCRVAVREHPVSLSPRSVALGMSFVAFADRLGSLIARRVTLVRNLRRQAGRCPLSLGLRTEVGDAQADLGLDRVVSLGASGLEGRERLPELTP
jgi:hypothetical protein